MFLFSNKILNYIERYSRISSGKSCTQWLQFSWLWGGPKFDSYIVHHKEEWRTLSVINYKLKISPINDSNVQNL